MDVVVARETEAFCGGDEGAGVGVAGGVGLAVEQRRLAKVLYWVKEVAMGSSGNCFEVAEAASWKLAAIDVAIVVDCVDKLDDGFDIENGMRVIKGISVPCCLAMTCDPCC